MNAESITRSYYLLAGLYTLAASLIWGVNTLFLLDAGLSVGEVFVANSLFSAGMVVFEIPTGVVADTLGRRVSYLASVAVLAVTTLCYLVAASAGADVVVFGAISLLMGLGFTFYSGALEAWLVDALGTFDADDDLDHVFARAQQVTGAAMLVGTSTGGLLGQIDLGVPFAVRVLLLGAVLVLAHRTMHDRGFTPRPLRLSRVGEELAAQTRVGLTYGWSHPGLRMLMLAGVARGAFLGWAFYAAQPYFLGLLERDAVWVVGLITALMSLSTIVGNQIVDWLTRRCGRRTTIMLGASMVMTVAAVVVGLVDSFWIAVPVFLAITGAMGVIGPVRQAYVHAVAPTQHRATVISFDAMLGSVGGVGGQLTLGRIANGPADPTVGFSNGYVVGGVITLAAWPLIVLARRFGGPADEIGGPRPRAGTCAAQGLPRATQVESLPRDVVTADD